MVFYEKLKEGCDDDVIGAGCVGIAVYGEVEVDGYHGELDDVAVCEGNYILKRKKLRKMN